MAQKVTDFIASGIQAILIASLTSFFGLCILVFSTIIGYLGILNGIF